MNHIIRLLCVLVASCAVSCSTQTALQKSMGAQMAAEAQQPLGAALRGEQRKSNFQSFYETNRTFGYDRELAQSNHRNGRFNKHKL